MSDLCLEVSVAVVLDSASQAKSLCHWVNLILLAIILNLCRTCSRRLLVAQKAVCSVFFFFKLFYAVCWLTTYFVGVSAIRVACCECVSADSLSCSASGSCLTSQKFCPFSFCLWIMVFVDNPFQREVVKNLQSTYRALWASWKRETQCNYSGALPWNHSLSAAQVRG